MTHSWTAPVVGALVLVVALAPPVPAAQECNGSKATIVGTSGSDELNGTPQRDVIVALGGNDVIFSDAGNDVICAGGGSDEAYGGGGSDTLLGQSGADTLVGSEGADKLTGSGGNDYLNGGASDDVLDGGSGSFDQADFRDSAQAVNVDLQARRATGDGTDSVRGIEMVTGSSFDDTLSGSDASFELFRGLAGNDTVAGRNGFDQLLFDESAGPVSADAAAGMATGEGDDDFSSVESFVGSPFGDTLLGHAGSDDIYGFDGNDTIDGRDGSDYLLGHAGDDDIAGGPGPYDMLDFETDAPVTVNASTGSSTGDGNDEISGFEIIGASTSNDVLIGSDADELFYPYEGDDSIDGRGGSDLVLYNVASGPISGDLSMGTAQGEGTDSLAAVEGFVGSNFNDTFVGDDESNLLIGGGGADELSGGDGDDYSEGGAGADTIDGGPGTFDMVNFFSSPRRVIADLADGAATGEGSDSLNGLEVLLGSSFSDALFGDDGNNYLAGRKGDDDLIGRGGDDIIEGGPGANGINGGSGTDVCLPAGSGTDCESDEQSNPPALEAASDAEEIADRIEELQRRHL